MNILKTSTVATGALLLGLALASCSSPAPTPAPAPAPAPTSSSDTTPEGSTGFAKLAPVIINPADITEGQVVEVMDGNSIDLTVDGNPAEWTGESSDPAVAEFRAGADDETVTFNPGISTVAPGESTITLTDPTGSTVTFTVSVTESTLPDGAMY